MDMDRPDDFAIAGKRPALLASATPPGMTEWPAAVVGPATHPRLPRILRCIDEELCDPALGIDTLQRRFFVSRPTLYRMFRPLGGVARYIRERRLLLAHRRLRDEPESTITFLLYDLGFESERQFQRAFQGCFGMSPTRWRQLCRSDAQVQVEAPQRRAGGGHGQSPVTQAWCG